MAFRKIINDSEGGQKYVTEQEEELVFDQVPKEGSFNPVTSGGVAKAIEETSDNITKLIPEDTTGENPLVNESGLETALSEVNTAVESIEGKIPQSASSSNKMVTEQDLQEAQGSWQSGFTPKGESTISALNGLTDQSNGDQYVVTDSGTLTDGSLAVTAGETVAWDGTNSVWYKVNNYALRQFGTDNVKNLPTSISQFRTGDVIPVDGPNGPAKMDKDDLLNETAQNALAGNVAPVFDPTKPNDAGGYAYYAGEVVIYGRKIYRFKVNHSSGAWNAGQVTLIDESDFLGAQKTTEVFNFVSTGAEIIQFMSTIPGELVKLKIDASNWTNNNYPASGRIFFIDGDSLQLPQIYLGSTIPNEYVFRASSTATYLHVKGDSGSRMQVKATHYGFIDSHKFDGCSQSTDLFEMGNIYVNPGSIGYADSTSRLRSKRGVILNAKAGDYIEVTNTNYYIGIGYKPLGESTWTWSNWVYRFQFPTDKDCEFVLLARLTTEATDSFDNLIKSFLVYTPHGSCSYNSRIVNVQNRIEAVDSSVLTKIRSVSFATNNAPQTITLGPIDDECWLHFDTQENIDISGVTDLYAFFVIQLSNGVDAYKDAVMYIKPSGITNYSRIKGSVYIPKGYGNLQLYMRASSLTKPYLIWIDKVPPVRLHYPSFGTVKSVAHRGCQNRLAARENTTANMRLAAIYGYKYVETDLHTTSDGYVVCFHDDAIPNLGNIADLTLAQVKTYQPSGFLLDPTIPTLEELLQVCKEYNLHPYLEIKGGGDTTASTAIAIVADYGMLDNVTWLCFTASYLQTVRTAYAKSRLGLLGGSIDASLVSSAQALKNDSNEVFLDVADASNYALAKAENIPVEVWTVSDLPAQHYVSGLTTNNWFPITGKYQGF